MRRPEDRGDLPWPAPPRVKPPGLAPSRGVAALLVLALGVGFWGVRTLLVARAADRAVPPQSGTLAVVGLEAALSIRRDASGVPHVAAGSDADAWFGLGFVHAQDRLAQMLWLRRLAQGRTAERIGSAGLEWDKLARTIGFARLASRELATLSAHRKQMLRHYAAGVEARLERVRRGEIPPPISLAGQTRVELAQWSPADSLALLRLVSWQAAGSAAGPIVLEDLVERLGGSAARIFTPAPAGFRGLQAAADLPSPEPTHAVNTGDEGLATDFAPGTALAEWASIYGGHAVAVSAAHTASGAPIVAVDYVLAPTAPSLFHLSHVRGAALDCAGAAIPGLPIFWSGRSRDVAWSLLPAAVSALDLFRESTRELASGPVYHDGFRWLPVDERVETIVVRDGEDLSFKIRSTRHGPLIDGLLAAPREPLALSWTGARERAGFEVLASLPHAASAAELERRLRRHGDPAVWAVFADAGGSIGRRLAGWLPRRRIATGLLIVPGRSRHFDWRDAVAADRLPADFWPANKDGGPAFVIAADAAPLLSDADQEIEWLWRGGEESRRLVRLMGQFVARGRVDLRDIAVLQADRDLPEAAALIGAVLEFSDGDAAPDGPGREVAEMLQHWDREVGADSRGAAAYHVFVDELVRQLFEAQLGESLLARYRALRHSRTERIASEIVTHAVSRRVVGGWADRTRVGAAVRRALRSTWMALAHRIGPSRSRWTWGRLHRLRFPSFLAAVGDDREGPLGSRAYGGSELTLRRAGFAGSAHFDVTRATTLRLAVDLGAPDQLAVALAPGQSEHPSQASYSSGLEPWLEGRQTLLLTTRLLVEDSGTEELRLEPAG